MNHLTSILKADCGDRGTDKNCHGKNAKHTIVKVPVGTIVRNQKFQIIADLDKNGVMFIAARGGAGGKGNTFFASDTEQVPQICEYGATGEDAQYTLEVRSVAHIGLVSMLAKFSFLFVNELFSICRLGFQMLVKVLY